MKHTVAGHWSLVVGLCAVVVPGCSDVGSAGTFTSSPLRAPREKIMKAMADVLEGQHFQIETRDDQSGYVTSKWRAQLAAAWRDGRRERVEMRILSGARPQEHVVEVIVYREINDNSHRPLSETEAAWIPWGGNDDLARSIATLVKFKSEGAHLDD